jgi:hypothetical protein
MHLSDSIYVPFCRDAEADLEYANVTFKVPLGSIM